MSDYDSDDHATDNSDGESIDPITIWGEDPDWVKNNIEINKSLIPKTESKLDSCLLDIECSICAEFTKSDNVSSINGCKRCFFCT